MSSENRSSDSNSEVIKQVFILIVKMWDKVKLLWSKSNRWHRVLFVFLIVELRLIPGGQVGFHCNDPALSHPFTGDTITWKWLFGTTLVLPLAILLLVERAYHRNVKATDKSKSRALRWYREYLFGLLINLTFVQTLKLIVGSPRPHFFDTCRPEEALSCQDSEYVSRYTCTKAHWQHQSDKSFPSGHTSLAVHAGIFIIYYLYQRTKHSASRVIVSMQSVCLFAALYCCVSRMTDHRHHWWDVLAGAAIATPIIWFTILSLCKNFECFETDREETDQIKNCVSHKETISEVNQTKVII